MSLLLLLAGASPNQGNATAAGAATASFVGSSQGHTTWSSAGAASVSWNSNPSLIAEGAAAATFVGSSQHTVTWVAEGQCAVDFQPNIAVGFLAASGVASATFPGEAFRPPAPQTFEVGAMVGSEWYTCGRCGFNYPRAKLHVQNGLIVCQGEGTANCSDSPGTDRHKQGIQPREKPIPPLPQTTEVL